MNIQQMEYVVALDDHRHFVRAAESCFVTQPTLTMQIKKLEHEIGLELFNRRKKPLVPTEAGKDFIQKCRQILMQIDQLKSLVEEEIEDIDGEFRLAIIPTIAPYLLPKFLPHFLEAFPNTKLIIQELQTEQIIDALHKGDCDLGLLATPLNISTLREIPVFNEPFVIYHHPNDKDFVQIQNPSPTLKTERLLLLEEGHCFREQTLQLCEKRSGRMKEKFVFQSGSIEALCGLVDQNLGYTLIPELSINGKHISNDRLSRFPNPQPSREVSIVVHQNFSKESLIEALHASIQQNIPIEMDQLFKSKKIKWR